MTIAFVLGNGKSRLAVDLEQLKSHGKVYACNAIYRHYTPDVLVATDPGISAEIMESGYAKNNLFYTRKPLENSNAIKIVDFYGYSSGPIALSLACQEKHHKIFMLGFDLQGVNGLFNNVYADTEFYKTSNLPETHYGNWINQVHTIATKYTESQIVHIAGEFTLKPDKWKGLLRSVSIDSFINSINTNKLEQL